VRATEFEYRHQTLLSQLLIGAGLATYLFDPEDVVWRFIKDQPDRRALEHGSFLIATVLIGVAAVLCTGARAREGNNADGRASRPYRTGEFLYAVGLGTLMPLAGFVILVSGQTIRILRLAGSRNDASRLSWAGAMRREAAKWGLLLTMTVFSITLVDRHADIGAGASYAIWALLNLPGRKTAAS
jgi:hypothetical protein